MSEPSAGEDTVRVERTIRAPPERVFQAFLDPDLIQQWMTPGEFVIDRVSVDPKVGGKIQIAHSLKGVSYGGFEGEFVKIVPNRELVYRWAFVGTEPEKGEYHDSLVTVSLRPAPGGKTRVKVVHEKLADVRLRAPKIFAQVVWGWNNSFDKLEKALAGP
ncbi:MAG: SRPBCC domain-containing protein [Thermoplasmata archaeon]|nr:SRPBCC domain-containing protein [Thermoplasmata archaeon]